LWSVSDTKFCAERQAIPQTYLQNNPHFSPDARPRARIKRRNMAQLLDENPRRAGKL
jgi:hypothetical protein